MRKTEFKSSIGSDNVETGNVTNSNNRNVFKFSKTVNVNKVTTDENQGTQWLLLLDSRGKHQDVRANRVYGVGNWLLQTKEFQEWRRGDGGVDKAVLFCCGNLGVGKTYLNSLVIDSLRKGEDIAITMFYCDFSDQQRQTTTNIVGAILKQLVIRGNLPEHVQTVFQKAKNEHGDQGLQLPDAVEMLRLVVATLPQIFICIDALDECLPKHQLELLGLLKGILQESPRTRIFITGRAHVKGEITKYFPAAAIVPTRPDISEIKSYLEKKLDMDTECDAMSDVLRADILRIIPESISEIFLLGPLNIDTILGENTISERRQKLNEITKGIYWEGAYAATLKRMREQNESRRRLGMGALMWVSNSERPLHTSELCHALGVEIGSTNLDTEKIPAIRTLLKCCLGLITVEASSSTVQLVHFTLQKYLSNKPSFFQNPHSRIAEVCLTYLHFQCVRELLPTLDSAPSTLPFVQYASCYWGRHIGRENRECVSPLALSLLVGFEKHISSRLLLLHYHKCRDWWELGFHKRGGPNGFTGLHGAAFLGIVGIVAGLLATEKWDINAPDAMGRTALAWAALGGHEDVVKILLQQKDINPNPAVTEHGQTALSWAAEGGHEGVVKLLLERRDIDPNTKDTRSGRTPLSLAAWSGHEGVVKLLLERRDINPSTPDTRSGRTPLWWAARCGRERVVKLLLERNDIDPNTADAKFGRTPLSLAAEDGYEGVVKLLLERKDIKPDTIDTEFGRRPLGWAAWGGNGGVVKLLLERKDINPNIADTRYGRTPLLLALGCGYEVVAKLLLKRNDINTDIPDLRGNTALELAAHPQCRGIVELLSQPNPPLPAPTNNDEVRDARPLLVIAICFLLLIFVLTSSF